MTPVVLSTLQTWLQVQHSGSSVNNELLPGGCAHEKEAIVISLLGAGLSTLPSNLPKSMMIVTPAVFGGGGGGGGGGVWGSRLCVILALGLSVDEEVLLGSCVADEEEAIVVTGCCSHNWEPAWLFPCQEQGCVHCQAAFPNRQ